MSHVNHDGWITFEEGQEYVHNVPFGLKSTYSLQEMRDIYRYSASLTGVDPDNQYEFPVSLFPRMDCVVPWVNMSDAGWQKNSWKWIRDLDKTSNSERFQEKNELLYMARSIYKHMPWVNQIVIVTQVEIPTWLNVSDDRIRIVHQREYIPSVDEKPLFDSGSIESQMYKIEGLSNKVQIWNDDLLAPRNVWPHDLWTLDENGVEELIFAASSYKVKTNWHGFYFGSYGEVARIFENATGEATQTPMPNHVPELLRLDIVHDMLRDLPVLQEKLDQTPLIKQFRSTPGFDEPNLRYAMRKYVTEWPLYRKDIKVPFTERQKKYKSKFIDQQGGYAKYMSIGYQNATDVIKALTESQGRSNTKFWCLNDCRSVCDKKFVNCTELDTALHDYLGNLLPCAPWEIGCIAGSNLN